MYMHWTFRSTVFEDIASHACDAEFSLDALADFLAMARETPMTAKEVEQLAGHIMGIMGKTLEIGEHLKKFYPDLVPDLSGKQRGRRRYHARRPSRVSRRGGR